MHICDIFANWRTTFSFEFFPPKNDAAAEQLYRNIAELEALHPSFVSVTYGAGGAGRQLTNDLGRAPETRHRLRPDSAPDLRVSQRGGNRRHSGPLRGTWHLERPRPERRRAEESRRITTGARTRLSAPPTWSRTSRSSTRAGRIPTRAGSASAWRAFPKAIPPRPTAPWK